MEPNFESFVFGSTVKFQAKVVNDQGCILVGGVDEVWRISDEGGRIEFIE